MDEVTRERRKLHTEELHCLYSNQMPFGLRNQEKLDGRDVHNVRKGGGVGEPERKRPPVRPVLRWEGNTEMNLQEVTWGEMD